MLWLWLLDCADVIVSWVTGWFPDWVIPFPPTLIILVPVPLGLVGASLDAWLMWTLLIGGALVIGRMLFFLYRLIPTNG